MDTAPNIEYIRRAAQLIEDVRGTEIAIGWENAKLSGAVGLLYRPDIDGVAYYEFQVEPAGFIILSTGDHDFPISHWNFTGEPPTIHMTSIARAAGQRVAKFYKIDTLAYVAENDQGEIVAQISQLPTKVSGADRAWLEKEKLEPTYVLATPSIQTEDNKEIEDIEYNVKTSGPSKSPLQLEAWNSWEEIKKGFVDSYGVFIEALRRDAQKQWEIEKSARDYGEGLLQGQTYRVALLHPISSFNLSGEGSQLVDAKLVEQRIIPSVLEIKVINIPPNDTPATFEVAINYANGEKETVKFFVSPKTNTQNLEENKLAMATVQSFWSDWSKWTVYWAGDSNGQRDYYQFDINGCASGCGATAWAMLFGWVDYQASIGNSYWKSRWGIYRTNGGKGADAVAPKTQDDGIVNITKEIRKYILTFCAFGQGATAPWDMENAYKYFSGRTFARLSTTYSTVGLHISECLESARNSIWNHKTPVIIGTGWLTHYPLAWGYKRRSRTFSLPVIGTITTEWQQEFYVNQGWKGSSGDGWINASTWFAGEILP